MRYPVPFVTLSLLIASSTVFAVPELVPVLIFDRAAIATGQAWRLLTGHLVHFSISHLLWNLLVMGSVGWVLERRWRARYTTLLGIAAVTIGTGLLLLDTSLQLYGGLSGLATAAVVLTCLVNLEEPGRGRGAWYLLLTLTAAKIAVEAETGQALFAAAEGVGFRVVPLAHLLGFVSALVVAIVPRTCRKRRCRSGSRHEPPATTDRIDLAARVNRRTRSILARFLVAHRQQRGILLVGDISEDHLPVKASRGGQAIGLAAVAVVPTTAGPVGLIDPRGSKEQPVRPLSGEVQT